MVGRLFSDQDLQAIKEAVSRAERQTRGEIVPMVVGASARYQEARHQAGLVGLFVALALSLTFRLSFEQLQWGGLSSTWLMLAAVVGYVVGTYIGSFPIVIRALVSEERMAMKVRLRAEHIFYQRGLHRTYGGTAVLILVSILERRVQVLADQAINEKVPPGTWEQLARELTKGIRQGRPTEAFRAAIMTCGEILRQHFPASETDNPNELGDELIKDPSV
jgi:putative membrane protein